jgi:cyclohexadienyl dehydratase
MRARSRTLIFVLLASVSSIWTATAGAQARFSDPEADVRSVFELIDARLQLMEAVAAWKFDHGMPIVDAARENRVLDDSVKRARQMGIEPIAAHRLFAWQIRLASVLQERYVAKWRAEGYSGGPIRDLNAELRPQLDQIGAELFRAIYKSLPELQREDFTVRYGHLADDIDLPGIDPVIGEFGRRSLLLAVSQLRATNVPALERVRASGILRIGTTGDYAPFSLERDGGLSGADVDLALELARSLGAEAHFVKTSWPTLMSDYAAGRFDVAMSGISVTPQRAQQAQFSAPYHRGGKTPIVRCGTEERFDTLAEIDQPTVRVIVNPGGTNEQFVREHVRRAQKRVHDDNRTIFAEIAAGRADVMITDDIEVELQVRREPRLCRATRATFTTAEKAILIERDAALTAAVDEWLKRELAAGRVERRLTGAQP